ncbi:MAG: hypothetical protein PHX52_00915 [Candidatus Pacebacteria bacterium]|nr:hypothetical protein [Candidatus Paceibacterota bacterium]
MTFYPTLTTLVDYRKKIEEIKTLKLEKVCVFFTGLNIDERKTLFEEIKKTEIKEIPFAHIKNDMSYEELDFLIKNYHTQRFNIHSEKEHSLIYDFSRYKDLIYIENVYASFTQEEINKWAGVCIDFSHLENDRLIRPEVFRKNIEIVKTNKIGCNHISAVQSKPYINNDGFERYDYHLADNLSDFDYLKKYDKSLFSDFCAIELNNEISFQLKAIDYVKKIING